IVAEDPAQNFLPQSGPVLLAREPHGPGVRVDSGYSTGDEVPPHYDSLLAKVIAHAPTRAEAIARLDAALARYIWLGVTTNVEFLRAALAHPEFVSGSMTTRFIEQHFATWRPGSETPPHMALVAVALADFLNASASPARHVTPERADAGPGRAWMAFGSAGSLRVLSGIAEYTEGAER
ncbi:MAG: acetyl-CoA carboxylase biotin carboxylase subunit, partial [Armatimonadota bacterium]|nr:acetyl-CoA carboxylase biotin carboxylase subunit [Armatimonadota bacterium]